jgi:glyoxylase-like metal-dependent hydrolase (beta-lactamase superfamily II)
MKVGSRLVEVTKIAEGLWRWTAPHPDWTPEADWDREVACFYFEGWEGVCLIDPLVPTDDEERFWAALDLDVQKHGLPVAVILTGIWHERSAAVMVERYGARVWAFAPVVPRLSIAGGHAFGVGDPLPGGVEALPGDGVDEVLLWIPPHRALVSGDLLVGVDGGVRVCPDSWLPDGVRPADVRANLRRSLDLPVERVLVGHGPSVYTGGRAALDAALQA